MIDFFSYNWEVRKDWFEWCREIENEELLKERTGGMGSFLKNLYHVADCERIWMNQLQGNPPPMKNNHTITTLE
ncbi:DinB family protein [Bacillus sp. NTK074B]|nr:DinB family protein [Bacillus sp. NTK074B]